MKTKIVTKEEYIARIIARALGHNDNEGMYWENYILAAILLIKEDVIKENLNFKEKR